MTLVVPDVAEVNGLSVWCGKIVTPQVPWTLRLYSNDVTPSNGNTFASFVEVVGGGYARFTLTAANWSATPGSPSVIQHPSHTFTFTGSIGFTYGYYIVDSTDQVVLAERFPGAPISIVPPLTITITPRLTMASVSGD